MNNKVQGILTVIGLIATISGVLITFLQWQYPKQSEQAYTEKILQKNTKSIKNANLILSGTNLKVSIKKGKYFYSGGRVNSISSEETIFINESQLLTINVTGININLYIDESIRENIVINNKGINLKIKEI